MKKIISILVSVMMGLALVSGCKKGDKEVPGPSSADVIKYAKYSAAAYKEKELKNWGATLAKTEPVKLLETLNVDMKGKQTEVARIKLSDDKELFIAPRHLGDKPVVFIEDTKAYVRNNASSKVYTIIPKGSIAFVVQENADWIQVYVGQVNGKWVTQQWVNGGFSAEESVVHDAKLYEESAAILAKPDATQDQKKQAEENLKSLESSSGIFADMARTLMGNQSGMGDPGDGDGGEGSDGGSGETATVTAAAGLTMRDMPGTSGNAIVVIPDGSSVKIIEKGDREETISGKTSAWYKVVWSGRSGWVFGGFLQL